MNRLTARVTLFLAAAATALAAGCGKPLDVRVQNGTDRPVLVKIERPKKTVEAGTVAPRRTLKYALNIPDRRLPAKVGIVAGGHARRFTLYGQEADEGPMYFMVGPEGIVGPRPAPIRYPGEE